MRVQLCFADLNPHTHSPAPPSAEKKQLFLWWIENKCVTLQLIRKNTYKKLT